MYQGLGKAVAGGSFFGRLFAYATVYIPMLFILMIILPDDLSFTGNLQIDTLIYLSMTLTPFIIWELRVRKFRRSHGFKIYGSIYEELEQLRVDIGVGREQKAMGKVGKNVSEELERLFALKEKGALSEEEYLQKKSELLK